MIQMHRIKKEKEAQRKSDLSVAKEKIMQKRSTKRVNTYQSSSFVNSQSKSSFSVGKLAFGQKTK